MQSIECLLQYIPSDFCLMIRTCSWVGYLTEHYTLLYLVYRHTQFHNSSFPFPPHLSLSLSHTLSLSLSHTLTLCLTLSLSLSLSLSHTLSLSVSLFSFSLHLSRVTAIFIYTSQCLQLRIVTADCGSADSKASTSLTTSSSSSSSSSSSTHSTRDSIAELVEELTETIDALQEEIKVGALLFPDMSSM